MKIQTILAAALSLAATTIPAFAEAPIAEVVQTFDQRPGNPSITPDGRILVSVHPLDHPATKIVEVTAIGTTPPYPTKALAQGENSKIGAAIAIRTDDNGVAWILDLATKRFIGWDTKTEKQVSEIKVPDSVLTPTSFLQDFALDQKRNRAIIADMTQGDLESAPTPAFISVDLKTGEAHRIAQNHASMMPESDGGFALNPITIDPEYKWIYFGAMHGRGVYRVPAASFDGDGASVASKIEKYGPKPFSDGITVDGAGNVYVTDIEAQAIGVTNNDSYEIIARLKEEQSWPDGFSFGPDGYVYATVNQLNRSAALNGGKDTGTGTYELVRVKALAAGTTGR